jgi:hypothetical protein
MSSPQNQRIPTSAADRPDAATDQGMAIVLLEPLKLLQRSHGHSWDQLLCLRTPEGFIEVTVNGESKKVPYYNP